MSQTIQDRERLHPGCVKQQGARELRREEG